MDPALHTLGFNPREAQIYLALLRKGALTAYELAQATRMNRSGLYETITQMIEKGFLLPQTKDNKKHFCAVNPEQLLEIQRLNLEQAQKEVKDLTLLFSQTNSDSSLQFFTGKNILKILIKDVLTRIKNNAVILSMAIDEKESLGIDDIFLKQYLQALKERGITELVLARKGTTGIPEARTTRYRFLPEDVIGNHPYAIYEDTVAFFNNEIPPELIIIRNAKLAESMRKQFMFFWEYAKIRR